MVSRPQIITVDPDHPDGALLEPAAACLRAGGLVAFPTETVYGLGAHALDRGAVRRIFAAKGRPSNNPLIIHVATVAAARELVTQWPEAARTLAAAFWPGPLTLVLPRRAVVPDEITAGLDSVAVRIPAHPVALELIRRTGIPLAAPSANRYTHVSPTRAEHVIGSLGESVDIVVDGGPTQVGIESTVVSLLGELPVILRPGIIDQAAIAALIPGVQYSTQVSAADGQPMLAPGQARKHYSPRAQLIVARDRDHARELLARHGAAAGGAIGWIRRVGAPSAAPDHVHLLELAADPEGFAARLYDALHELDSRACDFIILEAPPRTDAWHAIWDRIERAAD